MRILFSNLTAAGRDRPVIRLTSRRLSADILPAQGFSIISFKCDNRELLDQWNIEEFVGAEKDIENVSRETTAIFRKGFGPSIGPWFGAKAEGEQGWQHGVCRFADWCSDIEAGSSSVIGHLDGAKTSLLGKTLNQICGFHLDVSITYELTDSELVYRIENRSEDSKGTFGIHWYFKNPADTKVVLRPDMANLPVFDKTRGKIEKDAVVLDMNQQQNGPFAGRADGLSQCKASIVYSDNFKIDFAYDNAFKQIVVFNTKQALCVEPVSDKASTIGQFTEGEIRIRPGV